MTARSARTVLAAAAALVLTLAGCAVPGGEGQPGAAATYGDRVVTFAEVDAIKEGFDQVGVQAATPGRYVTFALMGPDMLELAREYGFTYADSSAASDIRLWQSLNGITTPASDAAYPAVTYVRAVEFLVRFSEDSATALGTLVGDYARGTEVAPRYGEFTSDRFIASIQAAFADAEAQSIKLGPAQFTVFAQTDGIVIDIPEWISRD